MSFSAESQCIDPTQSGEAMHRLIAELYPICRSITGDGVRETFRIIEQHMALKITEVATGTRVFDWTVPQEWNIKDAYVRNSRGEKIIDFKQSNLHVLNYSIPVKQKVTLEELKAHLFTIPEKRDWIPYRTSYYDQSWGFCVSQAQYARLADDAYEVVIDSSLKDGHLTYAEGYCPGESQEEVLISCHCCHPSLCNDNLSGIAVAVFLAKCLMQRKTRYSYRFLFIPATIGSIAWLASNEQKVAQIKHGLVAANLGDSGRFTYKKSRIGNAEIDRAVINALRDVQHDYRIIDFFPYGYDERQYCSPGFNLPVGCLMRTPHAEYPEYHTSADNLDFVKPQSLAQSLSLYLKVIARLESNRTFVSKNQKCEPQLGKRGIYGQIGGRSDSRIKQLALLWVLNLCDGRHSLLDISNQSEIEFETICQTADLLLKNDLLETI